MSHLTKAREVFDIEIARLKKVRGQLDHILWRGRRNDCRGGQTPGQSGDCRHRQIRQHGTENRRDIHQYRGHERGAE